MKPGTLLGSRRSKLLAAVDLSTASVSVFDAALDVAHSEPDAEIHLLHVRRPTRGPRVEEAMDVLANWTEQLPERGARIELHAVEANDVADAIVEFAAKLDADVILLGTHGRTGVMRVVLGSVAETVVRTAGCSVFIVRTKSHERGV